MNALTQRLPAFHSGNGAWAKIMDDNSLRTTAVLGGGISLLLFLRVAWNDYRLYLSYGPGGVPYNVWGWLFSTAVLRPIGTNVLTTGLYDKKSDKRSWLPKDWSARTRRTGERPRLGPHPVPQRQLTQLSTQKIHEKLVDSFAALVAANKAIIQLKPSVHEGHTQSIFYADHLSAPPIGEEMMREIAHIHATGDHSVHVVLAPQDCKKVIDAGWGQRHPLNGVHSVKLLFGWTLPKEYVLLYVPRSEEELRVVMEVVRASVGFMTNTEKVEG